MTILVVTVVVLLTMLVITITAISNNVTEVHDGIYRVVILSPLNTVAVAAYPN
jgi:hypothetical protein